VRGFEPLVGVTLQQFSRLPPSTAQPHFLMRYIIAYFWYFVYTIHK